MKYLLGLILLISVSASAQYSPTAAKTRFVNGIGLGTKDTATMNAADTVAMIVGRDSLVYFRYKGYWKPLAYNSSLTGYVKYTDTASMLSPYYRTAQATAALALKLNISDTAAMLSNYYNKTVTDSKLALKLNISDTVSMLSPYQLAYSAMKYSDTASMLSGYKTFYPRNAISAGTGISYNPSTGVITNTIPSSGGTVTSVATNTGTGITGGTITTSGTIAADTSILATRLRVQKGIDSVSANVNLRVKYTDTSSMLSPYYRTATATSALALKLNISDTATMLTPYARKYAYVPYTGATSNLNLGSNNIYANALYTGFSAITASGTQVVLTVNSAPEILVSGSGGQTIKLPDATTLQNGTTYSFNNNQSSGAITINNNSNTLVVSIPSGGYAEVILLDNTIAAGTWDRHFQAPSNVSWSTNTFDYPGSITSATWNGNVIAINRGGTGSSTQNFVDLTTNQSIGGVKTFNPSVTAASALAQGTIFTPTLTAAANSDVLVGLDVNPSFANGAFTGVSNLGLRVAGVSRFTTVGINTSTSLVSNGLVVDGSGGINIGNGWGTSGATLQLTSSSTVANGSTIESSYWGVGPAGPLNFKTNSLQRLQILANGNLLQQTNQNSQLEYKIANTTAGVNSSSVLTLQSDGSLNQGGIYKYSSSTTSYKILLSNDFGIYNQVAGDMSFLNDYSNGKIKFSAGGSSTAQATLFTTGNLAINSTTDAGYKLDVNGTGRFLSGSSSTIGLIVGGAGGAGATRQGQIRFGDAGTIYKIQGGEDYSAINFIIGSTTMLGLASTGAATFSSTLGINGVADNVKSGTYTPTIGLITNAASSTAYTCQYMRVGNVVTVSGIATVTATTLGTNTRISMTLPVSSNFDFAYRAGGGGGGRGTTIVSVISAGASTSTVYMDFTPLTTSPYDYFFSYTYLIL
jgi:hypothetical protein